MSGVIWKGALSFGLVHIPVSLVRAGYAHRQGITRAMCKQLGMA